MINLKIFRLDPAREKNPHYSEHRIEGSTSLLMALRILRDTQDESLAFRDYHCAKGACGSCMVRVDGKPRKACETMLEQERSYQIEPLEGKRVVKDLVVDMENSDED